MISFKEEIYIQCYYLWISLSNYVNNKHILKNMVRFVTTGKSLPREARPRFMSMFLQTYMPAHHWFSEWVKAYTGNVYYSGQWLVLVTSSTVESSGRQFQGVPVGHLDCVDWTEDTCPPCIAPFPAGTRAVEGQSACFWLWTQCDQLLDSCCSDFPAMSGYLELRAKMNPLFLKSLLSMHFIPAIGKQTNKQKQTLKTHRRDPCQNISQKSIATAWGSCSCRTSLSRVVCGTLLLWMWADGEIEWSVSCEGFSISASRLDRFLVWCASLPITKWGCSPALSALSSCDTLLPRSQDKCQSYLGESQIL
jgi:hypothetical protein